MPGLCFLFRRVLNEQPKVTGNAWQKQNYVCQDDQDIDFGCRVQGVRAVTSLAGGGLIFEGSQKNDVGNNNQKDQNDFYDSLAKRKVIRPRILTDMLCKKERGVVFRLEFFEVFEE